MTDHRHENLYIFENIQRAIRLHEKYIQLSCQQSGIQNDLHWIALPAKVSSPSNVPAYVGPLPVHPTTSNLFKYLEQSADNHSTGSENAFSSTREQAAASSHVSSEVNIVTNSSTGNTSDDAWLIDHGMESNSLTNDNGAYQKSQSQANNASNNIPDLYSVPQPRSKINTGRTYHLAEYDLKNIDMPAALTNITVRLCEDGVYRIYSLDTENEIFNQNLTTCNTSSYAFDNQNSTESEFGSPIFLQRPFALGDLSI